mmetsp:Transcript_9711/g.27672  ORF Transcript_9711/g.27672 Transcript_9711/m.27672 type:complete len:221 (+) Transcript_9711:1903-2565(+)
MLEISDLVWKSLSPSGMLWMFLSQRHLDRFSCLNAAQNSFGNGRTGTGPLLPFSSPILIWGHLSRRAFAQGAASHHSRKASFGSSSTERTSNSSDFFASFASFSSISSASDGGGSSQGHLHSGDSADLDMLVTGSIPNIDPTTSPMLGKFFRVSPSIVVSSMVTLLNTMACSPNMRPVRTRTVFAWGVRTAMLMRTPKMSTMARAMRTNERILFVRMRHS